jgi:hypothetical protein
MNPSNQKLKINPSNFNLSSQNYSTNLLNSNSATKKMTNLPFQTSLSNSTSISMNKLSEQSHGHDQQARHKH